MNSLFYSATSR